MSKSNKKQEDNDEIEEINDNDHKSKIDAAKAKELEKTTTSDFEDESPVKEISNEKAAKAMELLTVNTKNEDIRAKELAAIKINNEDVALLISEFEIPASKAELYLRKHNGNVIATIRDLITT